MKKTLTLMALLGYLAGTPLSAEEHWMVGVECHDHPDFEAGYRKIVDAGAYTFSKNDADSYATNQCWAASAADTLAWWEDRVEENGALIMHDTPRGLDLWKTLSPMFVKDGGYPRYAMNYWLWGELPSYAKSFLSSSWTAEHQDFKGYFHHLKGQMEEYNTEYIMIISHSMAATVRVNDDPDCIAEARARYLEKESGLLSLVDEGWGLTFYTANHVLTAYGFETDENGRLTRMWYTDNNPGGVIRDQLKSSRLEEEVKNSGNVQNVQLKTFTGYGDLRAFNAIRTRGIQFDTYDLTFTGADTDEALFSHYLNVTIDGHQDYQLKYDLRNALDDNSPVTAKDENGNLISTGDIKLKSGKLSLVGCDADRKELDGGGKTSGSITFEAKEGAERTLSVQHTDTIAKEIKINAANGNTLEVTEGNTASFGTLSGTGNLDKTGTGTAEVTDTVTLKGEIRVKEGDFIFGKDVVLTSDTKLAVSGAAHVQGAEGKSITLSINSGVHTNDGVMTLTTTIGGSATLKGSGTFGKVTVDGGTLIVGNSPGHQEFEDSLTLKSGKIVFSVAGVNEAASLTSTTSGWDSGTYSTIGMNGHEFIVGNDGQIVIALGNAASDSLPDDFCLTLVTGMGNTLSQEQLAALAGRTSFQLTDTANATPVDAPAFAYKMVGNTLMLTSGTGDNQTVPEPATAALGLLALAGLATRRRRK